MSGLWRPLFGIVLRVGSAHHPQVVVMPGNPIGGRSPPYGERFQPTTEYPT